MTAQEIFRLPAIDFIETEICDLYWQYEKHCYYDVFKAFILLFLSFVANVAGKK